MKLSDARREWASIITRDSGLDPIEAALQELAAYSGLPIDEVRLLSQRSNAITGEKWAEADRSTPEGLQAFYNSLSNWVFGTLMYHARQASGDAPDPLPALVADALHDRQPGEFLDFGSGVGTASILFHKIGWRVTAADVAAPLIDFARWRFAQRGLDIPVIDLNTQQLDEGRYDVIAAFNTMAHVRDVAPVVKNVARALRPGGLFLFDIDSRAPSDQMYWHIQESPYPTLRAMRGSGFTPTAMLGPLYVYTRVDRNPLATQALAAVDALRYSPIVFRLAEMRRRIRLTAAAGVGALIESGVPENLLPCA